jgi:hypothetical protein
MGKYLRISSYSILGSPSSYMTLQLLHSEFPYIGGKLDFLISAAFIFFSKKNQHNTQIK